MGQGIAQYSSGTVSVSEHDILIPCISWYVPGFLPTLSLQKVVPGMIWTISCRGEDLALLTTAKCNPHLTTDFVLIKMTTASPAPAEL